MPTEITLAKTHDGALRPVTATDAELVQGWRVGQGVRVQATRLRPRSIQHHKLYWGGLLELAMQYWEPTGGLIAEGERQTLERFAGWLAKHGANEQALRNAADAYMAELAERRAMRIETPHKSKQALHEWVKREAGYFDYQVTPAGLRKVTRSINFNAMDQDEFTQFYRDAFSVVWRFILSRTFADEAEAQRAVDQLVAMG